MFKGMTFVGSIALLPIVGQIPGESAVSKMAVGSAQMVLAIVVVAEAFALFKMFRDWRKDVERQADERQKESEQLLKVIEERASSDTELAISNQQLKASITEFGEVVRKCHDKNEDK